MDAILELSVFNHIKYHDEPHKYYAGERELISATTFIGGYKPKFESEKLAEQYALKRGLNTADVLADWDYKRDFSTVKGSAVHLFAENYWNNKIFPYDPTIAINKFGVDDVKDKYETCTKHFLNFYEDAKQNLIPVKMELVVGDLDYGIGGMVDCFFYNKKSKMYEIYDYKTNKEIKLRNHFGQRFSSPISHLDVCEINTYSLQLSLYKHIIEKNTNIKIGNNYLVWINENNDNYKIYQCKDYQAEVKLMIDDFLNKK